MMTTTEATAMDDIFEIPRYLAHRLTPDHGAIPRVTGHDIYGKCIPLNGITGGDLLSWVNFSDRYDLDARLTSAQTKNGAEEMRANLTRLKRKGGILLADVAGHSTIDTIQALLLYQAFHTGALYEIDQYGEITTRLFEQINTRFCRSTTLRNLAAEEDQSKFITMIYGEISDKGRFRFLCAGHPEPLIFSRRYSRFMEIDEKRKISYPLIGLQVTEDHPDRKKYKTLGTYKKKYLINELNIMGEGDILLMYTDGFLEDNDPDYAKHHLEQAVARSNHLNAESLCNELLEHRRLSAPVADDMSLVVIKYR